MLLVITRIKLTEAVRALAQSVVAASVAATLLCLLPAGVYLA